MATDFAPALPHGPITPVSDGIHFVRSRFRMGPGVVISRTMIVAQSPDGLALLNAARLEDAGLSELQKLGSVRHLVKLSDSHGLDEPFYVDRYKPQVWTLPGAKVRGGPASRELGAECPVPGAKVIGFPGTSGWRECALWLPAGGGTLVTCDALQNHCDTEGASFIARIMTPMMGFKGGLIVAPMWRKYQNISGAQITAAFEPLLALEFANLITGHGPPILGGASVLARAAVERAAAG